jgi:hypothetical protein
MPTATIGSDTILYKIKRRNIVWFARAQQSHSPDGKLRNGCPRNRYSKNGWQLADCALLSREVFSDAAKPIQKLQVGTSKLFYQIRYVVFLRTINSLLSNTQRDDVTPHPKKKVCWNARDARLPTWKSSRDGHHAQGPDEIHSVYARRLAFRLKHSNMLPLAAEYIVTKSCIGRAATVRLTNLDRNKQKPFQSTS